MVGHSPIRAVLWDILYGPRNSLTLPSPCSTGRDSLAFSPDGTMIACASGNFDPLPVMPNEIVLSEVATGRTVATLVSDY